MYRIFRLKYVLNSMVIKKKEIYYLTIISFGLSITLLHNLGLLKLENFIRKELSFGMPYLLVLYLLRN